VSKKHIVIIVPGLGDETTKIKWATAHWRKYGLKPVIHNIWWKKGNKHFKPKLIRLIHRIDNFIKDGNKVSLVGTSAGSSAVMNAYISRKKKISKVISICGRLKQGEQKGFRSFELRTATSLAFKESILMFEQNETSLIKNDRKKIMTVRALFDELVPDNTSYVIGANNKRLKTIEHVFSIWIGLSFYKPLTKFLLN